MAHCTTSFRRLLPQTAGRSFKKLLTAVLLVTSAALAAHGQARPTASRAGDLQIGVSYTDASTDYGEHGRGAGFYADFDFREHFGIEAEFHQVDQPDNIIYERTYEVGGRYVLHPQRHLSRVAPYAKLMYGRGVFNFPPPYPPPFPQNEPAANLAYNLFAAGAGVDIAVIKRVNVRAEYEAQKWLSFPPNGLTPQLVTFGVAYHFPAGTPH